MIKTTTSSYVLILHHSSDHIHGIRVYFYLLHGSTVPRRFGGRNFGAFESNFSSEPAIKRERERESGRTKNRSRTAATRRSGTTHSERETEGIHSYTDDKNSVGFVELSVTIHSKVIMHLEGKKN